MRIFSFKHQMSLVRNASLFTDRVSRAPISGNIDNPEGGLDALMQVRSPLLATVVSPAQVMVCGERIGWRENSRKIIIVATDRDFHTAMDGKLAGILEPNDGQCHLNRTKAAVT